MQYTGIPQRKVKNKETTVRNKQTNKHCRCCVRVRLDTFPESPPRSLWRPVFKPIPGPECSEIAEDLSSLPVKEFEKLAADEELG